ncbi:MAG TPA: tRNA (adenosine(37)-N6)-threonylcarbamoyltransferase complex dimerization subunit type 1 TsaB [Casimicrobiaceae bacterium]|nr:tRNA (adenosine(37)-N6)-threonylcarbamoyltransferase complex dimerization subunit type 1 TsaB [Casimicrobiaceae bacterium]
MRILAFDASTEICAVALGDGEHWAERSEHAGSRHSELLLPMIRALLAETGTAMRDLDGIAFGAGPGSFTGLRIACGVAQGLCLGADLPVVGIASLEAMAHAAGAAHGWSRVATALDARMHEVYFAAFECEGGRWRARVEPCVLPPSEVPKLDGRWCGAGNGFAAYPALGERLANALDACDESALPTAVAIGSLALPRFAAGAATPARDAAPLYVRHRVALTTTERNAGQNL